MTKHCNLKDLYVYVNVQAGVTFMFEYKISLYFVYLN